MRKHNGIRPVNKTDAPKKLGKRALSKSRRNDNKKIIEQDRFDPERMLELFKIAVKEAKAKQ